MTRAEIRLKNELKVLKKLIRAGIDTEMKEISVRKALAHLVLYRRKVKVKKIIKEEEFIVSNNITKFKFLNLLREDGLIEVDFRDKFNPKMRITEKGAEIMKSINI